MAFPPPLSFTHISHSLFHQTTNEGNTSMITIATSPKHTTTKNKRGIVLEHLDLHLKLVQSHHPDMIVPKSTECYRDDNLILYPDMTFAVDLALKTNYLPICSVPSTCKNTCPPLVHFRNGVLLLTFSTDCTIKF